MKRDDLSTIMDILNACARIQEFTFGFDRAAFVLDARTQSAVIHQVLILGGRITPGIAMCSSAHCRTSFLSFGVTYLHAAVCV